MSTPFFRNFIFYWPAGAGRRAGEEERTQNREARSLPADGQEERPAALCRYCRGEIYEWEERYIVDGQAVCVDCLNILAKEYFRLYKSEGGF